MDLYIIERMQKVLHGPINIFDPAGNLLHSYERGISQPVAPREFLGKGGNRPYIDVDNRGVAYAVIWSDKEQCYVVLGRIRMYTELSNEENGISYCGKEEFIAIVEMCWKIATGEDMSESSYLYDIMEPDATMAQLLTEDIMRYRERGKRHNPMKQEMREQESIRQGDLQALEESINEYYHGEIGKISEDLVRNYKNLAVWVVSNASRSAIKGGLEPEKALTMCDSFLKNIEDNLDDPLAIERAAREAEFIFCREVRDLHKKTDEDSLIVQVRDYVYRHVTEKLQVSDIAKEVGVSANYLSERFSRQEGIPLKQYIINEKVLAGEKMLKYTNKSIGEISELCAFGSQSRFTQYFKERHKMTPRQYRMKYQREN